MNQLGKRLAKQFPQLNFYCNYPLSKVIYLKIGGPSEVFVKIYKINDLVNVVQYCQQYKVRLSIFGFGSNILVADRGVKGLVIQNCTTHVDYDLDPKLYKDIQINKYKDDSRWDVKKNISVIDYSLEDYSEEDQQYSYIKANSGTPLPYLIVESINKGFTGLQWFAGIPSTVGGAVYYNIHGAKKFFNNNVVQVEVVDDNGLIKTVDNNDLESDYDYSRFINNKEIITQVVLRLYKGDKIKAKGIVEDWINKKKIQSKNSLGCVFKNLTKKQQSKINKPVRSIGYIVEHLLHLKGERIGQAMISDKHGAFIENLGGAKASDYLKLINLIKIEAQRLLDLDLKVEIVFWGFTNQELQILKYKYIYEK